MSLSLRHLAIAYFFFFTFSFRSFRIKVRRVSGFLNRFILFVFFFFPDVCIFLFPLPFSQSCIFFPFYYYYYSSSNEHFLIFFFFYFYFTLLDMLLSLSFILCDFETVFSLGIFSLYLFLNKILP